MKLVAKAHPIEKWRWLLEQPTPKCLLNEVEERERPPLVVVAEPSETENGK
jgi:hypothetical protein